jgi:short-subunit dehydrogenase
MYINRRSLGWSAALMGLSAAGFALMNRQRKADTVRNLRNKVVLITGGSRGLGFALATELASHGARLILAARNIAELERAKARLVETVDIAPHNVFIHVADVSFPDDVRELVEAGTAHFGQIDVLVNNAGIILVGPVESQTLQSFQQAMDINFYGALHAALAVFPQMLSRGDGAIVNIASIGGKVAFPHLLPYVASKFALTGWSQGLRAELAQKGIRVTTVTPGIMRTGSHIQARYTGNTQEEYRWFAGAASFPGSATNATGAARKIIKAVINNSAEVAIGLQAIAAARLAGVEPELTAMLLATANSFLPDAPRTARQIDKGEFWEPDHSIAGKAHRGSLPAALEWFGTNAINRYNQEQLVGEPDSDKLITREASPYPS